MGQWSWDSGLGTVVLGQWSWDSGLGTVVLGQSGQQRNERKAIMKSATANTTSGPGDLTNRRNFSIASKFIDGVKRDDLRTMLATYYTLSKDSEPTPEEMRQKSREYMLIKPKKYSYSDNRNTQDGNQQQRSSW